MDADGRGDCDGVLELMRRAQAREEPAGGHWCPRARHDPGSPCQRRRCDGTPQEQLLCLFAPLIDGCVRRHACCSALDPDDLFAETLLLFLRLVDRYDPSRHIPFAAYLRRMLPVAVHSHVRRQQPARDWLVTVADPDTVASTCAPQPGPEDGAVTRLCLGEALERLPERQRRVVRLYFMEGYTESEIALQLAVSQPAVSRLKTRALRRLRRELS